MNAIHYANSGDTPAGGKGQVVGYWAIAVSSVPPGGGPSFTLADPDKRELLSIARATITRYVRAREVPDIDTAGLPTNLKVNAGAFVTLEEDRSLRGCIGRFDATEPLYRVVQKMAVASATEDHRFQPVGQNEIDRLEIEISVLTPMRRISSIDEIQLGKHGIYIKKDGRSGTFLPQVATETGWTKEEFLGHCAQDKAGIGWDGWREAEIYVYEALVFNERDSAGRRNN
jgi:hypothetical protein